MPGNFSPQDCAGYFDALRREIDWQLEEIRLFGKTFLAPRLSAYYGDAGAMYRYSGVDRVPEPWTPTLLEIRDAIRECSEITFNSVLCVLYRDGNDSMGFHSDDERDLVPTAPICSLSFGATRTMSWRSRDRTRHEKIELADGDLLIMQPHVQKRWKHGIAKTRRPVGERINLTFRCVSLRSLKG